MTDFRDDRDFVGVVEETSDPVPTEEEIDLIELLGDCFVTFNTLPEQHPADPEDFAYLIHRLQDMVAGRATYRRMGWDR